MVYFTSSWDDGAPHDMKLAYLLDNYEQEATFYIPLANVEKRDVIGKRDIEMLSKRFEIGAHTMNHKYLDVLPVTEANYEVSASKKALEDITQKEIVGFCFPGGKYGNREIDLVKNAGFGYARTINQFKYSPPGRLMNTTLQAYDHSKFTYVMHLLKRKYFNELFLHLPVIMRNRRWHLLLLDMLNREAKKDTTESTVIHLWGHSWELEEFDMWKQLESLLKEVNNLGIKTVTNHQAMHIGAEKTWS